MASSFGQRVKEMRVSATYSQRELAKLIGTSAGLISFIERDRNRPNYEIVRRLAAVFSTSTDYLINGDSSPKYSIDELLTRVRNDAKAKSVKSKGKLADRIAKLSLDNQALVAHIIDKMESR